MGWYLALHSFAPTNQKKGSQHFGPVYLGRPSFGWGHALFVLLVEFLSVGTKLDEKYTPEPSS